MFRGCHAEPRPRGRVEYSFKWLLRRPMRAVYDTRRATLTFVELFPHVEPVWRLTADLRALVAAQSTRRQPQHKRLDARRARATCAVRGGHWSLAIQVRGANHEYAVRKALNMINDLFVMLQEHYPEYLVEHYGLSTE